MKSRLFVFTLFMLLIASPIMAQSGNLLDGCVAEYNPETDYFPDKVQFEYAAGVSVEYFNNYKVVNVLTPYPGAEVGLEYVLVQCGTPAPEGFERVFEVPIETIVSASTTFLPPIEALGELDTIVALDEFDFVTNLAVRERIDAGELIEVGGGPGMNLELLLDMGPDLVMTDAMGVPDFDEQPKLEEVGLPVVVNGDWVETTPLGRAEWVKFIALFYNREAEANAIFDDIVTRYAELSELAASVEDRPTVLTGSPYEGIWYTSGGGSYFAQLLNDAGADYLWADDASTGSLALDFESVLDRAADADFWVNGNLYWFTGADMLAEDERYVEFAPFGNDTIYANNAIVNEFGGNDFYESGTSNPDVVLADLIKIFHPELLPDHELVYYQRLETEALG